tara:strand:+ start:326 stop:1735 length:1410 start_codon:yes stop_codon:yes gene_type:complete
MSQKSADNIVVRAETVYGASHWGEENVYVFPPDGKQPRGVIWVIPPPSHTEFEYKDNPGFPGQHFAYDYVMNAIQMGDIPQDDWIVVIAHTHETSVERAAWNAKEIFNERGFNYIKHINLCGCCSDDRDYPFENVVFAMGAGAQAVDFNDPTLTGVALVDPAIIPPLDIPDDLVPNITMISNPNNFDTTTTGGQQAIIAQEQLADKLGDNAKTSLSDAFNFAAMAAALLAALNFKGGPGSGGITDGMEEPGATTCYKKANESGEIDSYEEAVLDDNGDEIEGQSPEIKYRTTDNLEEAWVDERGKPIQVECPDTPDADAKEVGADKTAVDEKPLNQNTPPPTSPTSGGGEYAGPQVIITSDRLLFNARAESILMSAGTHIGLSALEVVGVDAGQHFTVNAPEIYLGLGAEEPIVLGNELEQWLDGLLDVLSKLTYTNAGGPTGPAINIALINPLRSSLPQIKSPQNKTL